MAANPLDSFHIGADFFDIYNDNVAVAQTAIPQLPSGACNYVDLTPGAGGSRCGCRRFWSCQVPASPVPDRTGWCMCHHHACYHDEGARDGQQVEPAVVADGQENQRPRARREPLSPVIDIAAKETTVVSEPDFPSFGGGASQLSFLRKSFDGAFNDLARSQPGASMPDTLAWADFIQSQQDVNTTLPPIPPQCLMSQTASTTSSIQARYLRPFAGKGLQTIGGSHGAKQSSSSQQQQSKLYNDLLLPSQKMASGAEEPFVFVAADEGATPRPGTATTEVEPRASALEPCPREALQNLTDAVSSHAQRLDRLETISLAGTGHDECHDKHDQLDLRVTELESRVEEVEKVTIDNDATAGCRADRCDEEATPSMVSVVSSATCTSRPSHPPEIYSQLHYLQAQVTQLQSAIPTYSHAWEVEVVFLPFPLKKIWQHIHQFKVDASMANGDDWTQLPMTHSTSALGSQSPFRDWDTAGHDLEWLLPRACGEKSITDRRLRSRGLVKKVSVKGPDARSVQFAISSAFGGVFHEMQMHIRSQASDSRLSKLMGLQSAWVPLRKIHKDSRLRFLSPDEMLTPALWDVQFLNSVIMRSSEPRLFVTHPDAYLQDYQTYEAGWTWQKLRESTRVRPDAAEPQDVPEAYAFEECWAWDERLDDPPDAQASGSHREDGRHASISPSAPYSPIVQSWISASSTIARGQSALLEGRKIPRPPHIRTSSVPAAAPAAIHSPATAKPKHRVVSNGSRRGSPSAQIAIQRGIMKRRQTRSPSHARFTPRWTSSPSPMPLGFHERHTARGITPFAYATPFSNAPLQEARMARGSSVLRNEPQYPTDDEDDYAIHIYESGSDESFGDAEDDDDDSSNDGASTASAPVATHAQPGPPPPQQQQPDSQSWHLPEDEPWPGIEDRDRHHRQDGESLNPTRTDYMSDTSSQPSEYPSTQSAWPAEVNGPSEGFCIHEDE